MKKKNKPHKPKTVLKMIKGESSLVFVSGNKQFCTFLHFLFIIIIVIVSQVKYAIGWKLRFVKRNNICVYRIITMYT